MRFVLYQGLLLLGWIFYFNVPCCAKMGTVAYSDFKKVKMSFQIIEVLKDTTKKKPGEQVVKIVKKDETDLKLPGFKRNSFPASSLQQLVKDQLLGLYVQEASGEPGTYQYMFVRGTSTPFLNQSDLIKSQPLIIVDGLPIVSNESPIAFDIQQHTFNRIGPATNLLAGLNLDEIESIELLKNLSQTAVYGPKAANGVILIKTKGTRTTPLVSFNSFLGVASRPSVTTINGNFENNFRKPFYDRYALPSQLQSYPVFLKDSLSSIYYGPSNWTDQYYQNAISYNVNASVTGGSNRANFKFNVGNQKSSGNADQTYLDRYSAGFLINISPTSWMTVTTNINASKLIRQRNRYNRDRFAEVRYLPELSQAPAPNLMSYQAFIKEYDKSIDNNSNTIVNGFLNVKLKFGKVDFNTRFGVSYNEAARDIFFPSTLLDNNNYVSNYFGFSQRLMIDNTAAYKLSIGNDHEFDFLAGQSIQWDLDRYNYAYAYRGPNDFLKVNLLTGSLDPVTFERRLIAKFLDGTNNALMSFYAKSNYTYRKFYTASLVLRADGSSNAQPTSRWFYSPIVSAGWDLKNDLLPKLSFLSTLKLKAGYGRMGVAEITDRYATGPLYNADIGWSGEPRIPSFLTITTLSRPYAYGYTGYNIPWSYNEQFTAGLDFGFWKNRLNGSLELYSTTTKDQVIGIPSAAEYGYSKVFYSGMDINNSGIGLSLSADITKPGNSFQWTTGFGFNSNINTLKSLPNNYTSVVVDSRKLQVGKSVDQYWLLRNDGVYYSDDEVPVNPNTGKKLSYKGIPLRAGDPKWRDITGDFVVDDDDKVLTGHILPVVSGNFTNSFQYKKWTLSTDFYFNLGRQILNQNMANRFNFVNLETANNIGSTKEITFWEKQGDYSLYPRYNPWSTVVPYRSEQDLFLENGSFLKLRNVSIGYDLTKALSKTLRTVKLKSVYVYTSVSNVFTLTPYTGRDPELVDYLGNDTGYGLPIPRTFLAGLKVDF